MSIRIFAIVCLLAIAPLHSAAQSTESQGEAFTLEAAINYALKNNLNLLNSTADVEAARLKVKEISASGLPQVNAGLSYNNNIQIPTQIIPNFTGQGPEYLKLQFGVPHTATASISAGQLIFDGTFFLGLRAAREYVALAEQVKHKSELDAKLEVTRAYYMVLFVQEARKYVKNNIKAIEKTYGDVQKLHKEGFAEKIDVSRLELALSNLQVQDRNLDNQEKVALMMLKAQMGMQIDQAITLADDLKTLYEKDAKGLDLNSSDFSSRPELQILKATQGLNSLDMRRYRVGYLPTLTTFISHQQNTFRREFNFFESNLDPTQAWFPATIWGVQLSIPIFDGGRKHYQYQQAKIGYLQTSNRIKQFELFASLELESARTRLNTAVEQVKIQEKNLALADEIYRISEAKYREGVGSSLELTNAETDRKNAQTNYLNSIYEVLIARIEFLRSNGKFN